MKGKSGCVCAQKCSELQELLLHYCLVLAEYVEEPYYMLILAKLRFLKWMDQMVDKTSTFWS